MFERTSALAGLAHQRGPDSSDGRPQLEIGEVRGFGLVQLAAFGRTLRDLEAALARLLGGDLPASVGEARPIGGRLLFKTGPQQFWIVTPDGEDLARTLEPLISPAIGAVTSLSHSRTRIFIEGHAAREVLAKGITVDLHPGVFRVNAFALTGLHHTPVLLHRTGEDRYELYVLRTFALWLWEWLIDAALPLVAREYR